MIKIMVSKITYKNQERLKLIFPYDKNMILKVKEVPGARWSSTLRAWFIPVEEDSISKFKKLFPDVELGGITKDENLISEEKTQLLQNNRTQIRLELFARKIILKMPKNEDDIRFIKTLRYSRWNHRLYSWEIPNYPGNLDLIKDYFKNRLQDIVIHENQEIASVDKVRSIGNNDLYIIKTKTWRIRLLFGFNRGLLDLIKKHPYRSWDAKNKWWTIPYSTKYLDELKAEAEKQGMKIIYEEDKDTVKGVNKVNAFDVVNYRTCPEEMLLKLTELRYSENTIKTYKGLFEEFINYYHTFEVDKIEERQVIAFLRYLVMERKVSTSYQNQSINAIKFYYEKVLGGQRKFYFIDRPKKERTLPTVLNEEEVKQLFACVENMKHKCMLMLAYSSGLRVGEIIQLRLTDIDRERLQISVKQGKGKKDRYTKLSVRFLTVLDRYIEKYKPKDYVFEGATGGVYSSSSLQKIIRAAAQKAGIKKRVTMHTLRHTFATHCLENGVDLRYIQSMMGHESSRTTEIYTHITTKGFDQIKSPLDKLDF